MLELHDSWFGYSCLAMWMSLTLMPVFLCAFWSIRKTYSSRARKICKNSCSFSLSFFSYFFSFFFLFCAVDIIERKKRKMQKAISRVVLSVSYNETAWRLFIVYSHISRHRSARWFRMIPILRVSRSSDIFERELKNQRQIGETATSRCERHQYIGCSVTRVSCLKIREIGKNGRIT